MSEIVTTLRLSTFAERMYSILSATAAKKFAQICCRSTKHTHRVFYCFYRAKDELLLPPLSSPPINVKKTFFYFCHVILRLFTFLKILFERSLHLRPCPSPFPSRLLLRGLGSTVSSPSGVKECSSGNSSFVDFPENKCANSCLRFNSS